MVEQFSFKNYPGQFTFELRDALRSSPFSPDFPEGQYPLTAFSNEAAGAPANVSGSSEKNLQN